MRKIDRSPLFGTKVNRWTILGYGDGGSRHQKLRCQCDCGKISEIGVNSVLKGVSKGCIGCRRFKLDNNPSWRGHNDVPMNFYSIAVKSAKARGLPFEVSIEDVQALWDKCQGKCMLTGVDIALKAAKADRTASLDRIDSGRGYVMDNLQFVHKDVNLMKNRFDQSYFISMCEKVVKRAAHLAKNVEGTACESCAAA